jgi:hypothetical protein
MTNQYFLNRIAARDSGLRASDADRERVAERLRDSQAEGRLDIAEFQDRLEHCYEAKTLGELDELVRDLPRQAAQDKQGSTRWVASWRDRLGALALILIVLIVASASAGHHHHGFWLWIPLAFIALKMSWWRRSRRLASPRRRSDNTI